MNEQSTRKEIRLKNFDYSVSGAYFVTICSKDKEKIFWSEAKFKTYTDNFDPGNAMLSVEFTPCLSAIGLQIQKSIENIARAYPSVTVDKYCIMPDHVHMMLYIHNEKVSKSPSLSRILQQFKGTVTKNVGRSIWQRSFYDHIIRNQDDYNNVWEYIDNNPLKYLLKKAPF